MTKAFTKAEEHAELDSEELYALARIDFEKGNLEGALRKLKPVLAEKEPLSEALALGARVYTQLRLFERASALFKRYLVDRPDAIDEIFQLGMLNFESGNVEEALVQWSNVLKIHPSYPPALFFSGLALVKGNKIPDAKRLLEILLQSAAVDNLYFNKAKDLLETIESGVQKAAEMASFDASIGLPLDKLYKGRH